MKGVVLAGGLGTRMGDLTRITNKHLLPVYDRPMIYYPIQYLVDAGIKDIMIVTGGEHAGDFLRLLRNGDQFGCRLHYAYQEGNTGIAAALKVAEGFWSEDEAVCVLLGDNLYEMGITGYVDQFNTEKMGAFIVLAEVASPQRFGVPVFGKGETRFNHKPILRIEEKPAKPMSPYAVTGFYIYDSDDLSFILEDLKPSARGELEITDVNNEFNEDSIDYAVYPGWWIDCGTPDSLLRASNLVKNKEIDSAIDKDLKAVK